MSRLVFIISRVGGRNELKIYHRRSAVSTRRSNYFGVKNPRCRELNFQPSKLKKYSKALWTHWGFGDLRKFHISFCFNVAQSQINSDV